MVKSTGLFISLTTAIALLAFAQEDTLEKSMKRGEEVYNANCMSCHMAAGEGVEALYPPLTDTAYMKDQDKIIDIIINGQEGEITVNNKPYNLKMEPLNALSDKEAADVVNYISNNWGNKNPMVKPAQIKAHRK